MKLSTLVLMFLLGTHSLALQADDQNLEQQLAGVKTKIEQEQVVNAELKERLAVREGEMGELKQKLKDIEILIAALKTEHNLN